MLTRLGIFIITVQIIVICVTFFMIYSTRSGQHQEVVNVLVNLRPLRRNVRPSPELSPSSVSPSNSTNVQYSIITSRFTPPTVPRISVRKLPSKLPTWRMHKPSLTIKRRPLPEPFPEPLPVHTTRDQSIESRIVNRRYNTFLLIMIPIVPSYFTNRELIRNTWYKGFNDSEDVMLRFAMGTEDINSNLSTLLTRENDIYKDMIFFENFKENKSALTNKTLLLITWAHENVNFTYFLKCDDDTFVFVKRTIAELLRRPTTTRLYYGKIQKGRPKKKNSPWQDPGWNLGDTYLPYALGGAYIISSDLIGLVAEGSEYLQWHPNEDTAVGSWLAPYKYERRDNEKICMFLDEDTKSKRCPEDQIIHLFYGLSKDDLKQRFLNLTEQLT
ncbi:beta-1,3-galactosyltransferase 6-like [Dysidea avara]|uniref:beta-1,3-galactosyltransferase 6-like n=1 Tax=Dysidea avara TaxID=196820 RepID=UPI003329FE9D